MLCGKMASNCWSHETFPAWKQTVSFTAHSSLIYSVHWKMSLKKRKGKRKKSNHNNPGSLPAYKRFECHSNTFVTTQLGYAN